MRFIDAVGGNSKREFMKEEFLHYLWRFRLFNQPLYTTQNEAVEVLFPGMQNTDAGPDFIQTKIKIGNTIWAGNAELHLLASDWNRHQHQNDKAYNNTVLHIVYRCDAEIELENGEPIPCLELKNKFDLALFKKYEGFLKSKKWIPCSGQLKAIPEMTFQALYSRMSIERLENKTTEILKRLEHNKNDWEETFYQVLAGGFGLKINEEIFRALAETLPLQKVLRQQKNLFQMEALLFGQSGLLDKQPFSDEYPLKLKKEYDYLAKKYQLIPLKGFLWKYLRLRPSNFPNIRIAQFAALLFNHQNLFSKILEQTNLEELKALYKVEASAYWNTHFVWDKLSRKQTKTLSDDRINLLLINVILPFIFLYGKHRNKPDLMDRALNFMHLIPAEKNKICENYRMEGLLIPSAFQTQALLQLKRFYCDAKKCLNCPVGNYLLK